MLYNCKNMVCSGTGKNVTEERKVSIAKRRFLIKSAINKTFYEIYFFLGFLYDIKARLGKTLRAFISVR